MILFLPVVAAFYGAILFLTARRSVWWPVGIHCLSMAALVLGFVYMIGYSGGSDPAGNGMEAGFLALFYYAMMTLATVVFLACMLWWCIKVYPGKKKMRL